MPVYRYKAISQTGCITDGESASPSSESLISVLESNGFRIIEIRARRTSTISWPFNSITLQQFSLFVQEFLTLLRAGLPVTEALQLSSERQGEPILEKTLQDILQLVRGGASLSAAFAAHQDIFDGLFVAVLKTGEKSGNLSGALEYYFKYLNGRIKLRKKLLQAMAYPIFLSISLIAILSVMLVFVMPRFMAMYENFNAKLPAPTQALIDLSHQLPVVALAIGVLVASYMASSRTILKAPKWKLYVERIRLSIPMWGGVVHMLLVAQIARTLATLVSAGMPLVEALSSVREMLPSQIYVKRLTEVEKNVLQGRAFSEAVSSAELMPQTAVKLLRVGEASGCLDSMLNEIAKYYDDQVETKIERVMSLVEPMFVLLMGLIVGTVIIIMYLPIFKLAEVV